MTINPYEPSRVASPLSDRRPFGIPAELAYELTSDDFVAFNLDYARHSTANRVAIGCTGAAVALLAMLILGVYLLGSPPALMEAVSWMFFTILFVLILASISGWFIWRGTPTFVTGFVVRSMLMAGDTSSIFGQYRLVLAPEEIVERAPKAEYRFPVSAIQKLVLNQQRLYIYVSPLSALIIPGRALDESQMLESIAQSLERLSGVPVVQR